MDWDLIFYLAALLLLPTFIYSIYVSVKVNSTFKKYSTQLARSGMTAHEVTRRMLQNAGLEHVKISRVRGHLTDHYNPKNNTIYLSESVYSSSSVSAIGVAAHETGHAMQHNEEYVPLKIRSSLVPAANIGTRMSIPLILIGFFIEMGSTVGGIGQYLVYIGLAFYALSTLFMLVTLPVEFNASTRAKRTLSELKILDDDEVSMAGAVLSSAAKTYVASFALSLLYLLRMISLFGRRR